MDSELQMQAQPKNRYRTTVAVVRRVIDELVVGRELGKACYSHPIVGFEDLLGTSIWQLTVANDSTQTPGGKIELARVRDPIDCTGQAHIVVWPTPA